MPEPNCCRRHEWSAGSLLLPCRPTSPWLGQLPSDHPWIFITLGTAFTRDINFFLIAARAAAEVGGVPILAVGKGFDAVGTEGGWSPREVEALRTGLPQPSVLVDRVHFAEVLPHIAAANPPWRRRHDPRSGYTRNPADRRPKGCGPGTSGQRSRAQRRRLPYPTQSADRPAGSGSPAKDTGWRRPRPSERRHPARGVCLPGRHSQSRPNSGCSRLNRPLVSRLIHRKSHSPRFASLSGSASP